MLSPKSKLILVGLTAFCLLAGAYVIDSEGHLALGKQTVISAAVKISASVGERKLTIFGWAPSESKIIVDGISVYDTITAAKDGYFTVSGIFLPTRTLYPEICLQAQDAEGRTTQPTCIPALPVGQYYYEVGPILLSPFLSLEKGEIIKGDQAVAYGKTTPQTQVDIFLAREKTASNSLFSLVRTAFAYNIPKYQIKSDENGNFEFNLPTEVADKWLVFAGANIQGSPSPKSNTLTFNIHSGIYYLWILLQNLFALIRSYLLYFVILIEVLILIPLLKRNRHSLR